MARNEPYIKVQFYNDDCGGPSPPNCYRLELCVGKFTFISDDREENYGFMSKEKANLLAKKMASKLGIEAKLAED